MTKGNDPIGINARAVFIPNDMPVEWQVKVFDLYQESIGLTKREWYSGLAMQGLMAVGPRELMDCCSAKETVGSYVARQSVDMADLLIAELSKGDK